MLDTCLGRPSPGVNVALHRLAPGSADGWERLAGAATNHDGRIPDLLPAADGLQPGTYRITFDTDEYMARCRAAHPGFFADRPFYPSVSVHFEVAPEQASVTCGTAPRAVGPARCTCTASPRGVGDG